MRDRTTMADQLGCDLLGEPLESESAEVDDDGGRRSVRRHRACRSVLTIS
jgi:hypothetical protein